MPKKALNLHITGPLSGESIGDQSSPKGPIILKVFLCHDVIMIIKQFVSDNSIQAFLSNNTNIFYLAVGCACAFILMIAVAVAIYYCCANKAARNQRLRYVSQDSSWWK